MIKNDILNEEQEDKEIAKLYRKKNWTSLKLIYTAKPNRLASKDKDYAYILYELALTHMMLEEYNISYDYVGKEKIFLFFNFVPFSLQNLPLIYAFNYFSIFLSLNI